MHFIFFHPCTIHSLCARQHLQLYANVQKLWWHCNMQVFAFIHKGSYINTHRAWIMPSDTMEPPSCWGGMVLCHVIRDNHKNGACKMLLISSLILEAFIKASSCLQCSTKYKPTFNKHVRTSKLKLWGGGWKQDHAAAMYLLLHVGWCHVKSCKWSTLSFIDIYKGKKAKAPPFHNLNVKHKLWKQHMLEPQRCS